MNKQFEIPDSGNKTVNVKGKEKEGSESTWVQRAIIFHTSLVAGELLDTKALKLIMHGNKLYRKNWKDKRNLFVWTVR